MNLSDAQLAVVNAPIGAPLQVLASAGSGKTRVLTERVRRIIETTKKGGVIAFTFTNKATEEMRERLSQTSGFEDRCWIATIHSVAQRILEQYGYAVGLPSELHIFERDQDRKLLFAQSLQEAGLDVEDFLGTGPNDSQKNREKILDGYLDQFSIVKRELLTSHQISERFADKERFLSIFQAYQDALLQSGGIDFDDILVYAHRILTEQPWCGQVYRAKYKHVCVDESQDLNKAQYEFIKALCSDEITSLMMVGDPNQMIYGFNSSSIDFLCREFISDFDPLVFHLRENFRSSMAVIRFANKLKPGAQVESQFVLPGRGIIQRHEDEDAEAEWVGRMIVSILEEGANAEIEGGISLDNMVVIARNRFVFGNLEERLANLGLPYFLKKGDRQAIPSSIFGQVLDLAIRLRINSKDWIAGTKLCEILGIQRPKVWDSSVSLTYFVENSRDSQLMFRDLQHSLLQAVECLDLEQPNIPKFCTKFEGEVRELVAADKGSSVEEIERTLHEIVVLRKNWTNFKTKGLGNSLPAFRNAIVLGQCVSEPIQAGLALSTVHTMKGLEKDIVFLMGMCEGVFPDYRAKSKREIDEERNNAFVAVTRARRWIYITYPIRRRMPWGDIRSQMPSRFIQELER